MTVDAFAVDVRGNLWLGGGAPTSVITPDGVLREAAGWGRGCRQHRGPAGRIGAAGDFTGWWGSGSARSLMRPVLRRRTRLHLRRSRDAIAGSLSTVRRRSGRPWCRLCRCRARYWGEYPAGLGRCWTAGAGTIAVGGSCLRSGRPGRRVVDGGRSSFDGERRTSGARPVDGGAGSAADAGELRRVSSPRLLGIGW